MALIAVSTASAPEFMGRALSWPVSWHNLLRNGARLAENAAQILDDLQSSMAECPELQKIFSSEAGADKGENGELSDDSQGDEKRAVLSALRRFVSGADSSAVSEGSGLPPNIAAKILTMLTLESRVEERQGKFYLK